MSTPPPLPTQTPPPISTDGHANSVPKLLPTPRSCSAGDGVNWLTEAFNLFRGQWKLWIGISLVYMVIMLLSQLSVIASAISSFVMFIFLAGVIKGAATQAEGGTLEFEYLFAGFKTHLIPLLILTLVYFVVLVVMLLIAAVIFFAISSLLGGFEVSSMTYTVDNIEMAAFFAIFVLMMVFSLPVIMAIWFAPALIILNDIPPIQAMKMSFKGCLKNIVPGITYMIVTTLVFSVGIIFTIGFGAFVLVPILMISYYTSYRDVWTDQPLSMS